MRPRNRKSLENLLDAALPVALAVMVAVVGYLLFVSPHKHEAVKPEAAAPAVEHASKAVPPKQEPKPEAPVIKPAYRARIAIVIDDLGPDMSALDGVLRLPAPVAVAVLPGMPYSQKCAQAASAAGRDVLLHLPMQPKGDSMRGLGPGALMEEMDGHAIARTVEEDLVSVPGAVGVNNHMGSLLTESQQSMGPVMDVLGRRGLFFLDSRTSSESVALAAARERGVPAATRNVFLDDADDEAEIKKQFDRLVAMSLKNGEAIAIGHPRPATLKVLEQELPGLGAKGIEVVRVSKLMR